MNQRFLLRGRGGAQTEISPATLAYDVKRTMAVLGGRICRLRWTANRTHILRPLPPRPVECRNHPSTSLERTAMQEFRNSLVSPRNSYPN
jgi:hypothetical protein